MQKLLLAGLVVLATASSANAEIVYSNNFDAENGGVSQLNYNGLNGLTVTDGTIDLVRSGDFGITCPGGSGSCIDLDGSTGDAGVITSGSYAFTAGQAVTLGFTLTGSQRGSTFDGFEAFFLFDVPTSGVAGYSSSIDTGGTPVVLGEFFNKSRIAFGAPLFPADYPADVFTFFFTATNSGTVRFGFQSEEEGAPPVGDNIGMILDDVSLDIGVVPEPATWAMMITGFGFIGATARRRRARAIAQA